MSWMVLLLVRFVTRAVKTPIGTNPHLKRMKSGAGKLVDESELGVGADVLGTSELLGESELEGSCLNFIFCRSLQ